MQFPSRKICIAVLVLVAFAVLAYYVQFSDYFTLAKLKANHRVLHHFVQQQYLFSVFIYIGIYALLLACALPIVMPFSLIGGFLYGIFWGLLYATVSCLIGSIVSFIVLRYIVAHWISGWHNDRIERFNQQVQKYGYSYLLMLHYLSIVPLFVINLLAAVANVPFLTVMWVTILGTLPLNILCVLAGQKLSEIHSFKDIFSPTIIVLLGLLAFVALVPMLIRKIRGSFGI